MVPYPKGIVVAMITPLTENMEINVDGIESLVNFFLEKGINGFFLLGTYGEGMLLNKDDRKKVLEKVIDLVPSKLNIISHIGTPDVKTAFELAKHSANLGISAISSVGPIYHKPDRAGLISYYSYLSKANVPIMVYNNKGRQGYNISPDDFEAIITETKNVVGIKDASYDVEQLQNYVNKFSKNFYIAGAGDSLIAITFMIGAEAHICGIANAFPEIPLAIYNAIKEGSVKKAIELQGVINSIREEFKKFKVETQTIIREALRIRGIDIGDSPIPLRKLSEEEKSDVKRIYEHYIEYIKT